MMTYNYETDQWEPDDDGLSDILNGYEVTQ